MKYSVVFVANRHNFISVKDIEKLSACMVGFLGSADTNTLSEFSREEKELPWQSNFGQHKPTLQ